MIDHTREAIYFHIGKTAGSSIEKLLINEARDASVVNRTILYGYDDEEGIFLQHASAEMIRRLVGATVFEQYFKFTIVRNPFTRALSVYHYLIDQHKQQFGSFRGYVEALPGLVADQRLQKGSHHAPQTLYTHIDGDYICDYVGKFEDLPQSIIPVQIQLNIDTALKKHNAYRSINWSRKSVASYYTDSMIKIMREVYADDFFYFDYSTNPKDVPFSFWRAKLRAAKPVIKPYIPKPVISVLRRVMKP